MTGFLLIALVLVAGAVVVVVWPLLSTGRNAKERRAGALVALYRDQLRELEAERAAGAVDEAQYQQTRQGIERSVLEAVTGGATQQSGPPKARWSAVLAGIVLVVVPIALYGVLGTPEALIPGVVTGDDGGAGTGGNGARAEGGAKGEAAAAKAPRITPAQVQKMIASLVAAVEKNPGDAPAWTMLARAYSFQHQYPDAVRAFTKAVALTPKDARLLADLADAMAMSSGQRLDGEPMRLVERALAINPKEIKALALAGTQAYDHQQYAKAADYWERALAAAPNDPEFTQNLRSNIAEARQLAAGGGASAASAALADTAAASGSSAAAAGTKAAGAAAGAGAPVRGRVALAAALAGKAKPEDTVFVFARAANGPKVPLAMLRRQVKDLPFDFSLDDSMAMMPEYTVSKYAPVIIGARISRTGDAIAAPGDMQGFSGAVAAGSGGVQVNIDQVVK